MVLVPRSLSAVRADAGRTGAARRAPRQTLLADAQPLNERRVALGILALDVIEQAAALADQLQQAAPRVVVLRVGLEMLREVIDPLAEQRHLDFGGPGVRFRDPVPADNLCLSILRHSHVI